MGYPGGKSGSGVFQALINWMPPHSLYVEPFLGGGAVMRFKRPAELNIGIDLDPEVISQWSTVSGTGGAGSGGAAGGGARIAERSAAGTSGGVDGAAGSDGLSSWWSSRAGRWK
jgi:hypothetical protein